MLQRPSGSHVALPTPFRNGELDLEAFHALVDEHASRGTDGIVVCGTTGEAPTLTERERRTLIETAVERAAGRLAVLAGVGCNATRSTVELARFAAAAGADGLLVVTPYYNRPSRAGLLGHFGAVADAVDVPVVLYNVPTRTATDVPPDLVAEIANRWPNVVAIKEVTRSVERIRALVAIDGLAVLCGEDAAIADFMREGGDGAVSVIGNVAPDATAELIAAARPGGDAARAAELVERLAPLARDLYVETNPGPVKAALAWLGWCAPDVRAPLAPLEEASRLRLERTLRESTVVGPMRAAAAG